MGGFQRLWARQDLPELQGPIWAVPHDNYGILHPYKHSHLSKPEGTKNAAEKDAIAAIKTRNQLAKPFLEDLQ